MEAQGQITANSHPGLTERRHAPRFRFEVDIWVRTRHRGSVKGHTVDLSESGIAVMLTLEVPPDELVELVFVTPFGPVTALAMLRQRCAFRYGFQFVEPIAPEIHLTCRYLAKPVGSL